MLAVHPGSTIAAFRALFAPAMIPTFLTSISPACASPVCRRSEPPYSRDPEAFQAVTDKPIVFSRHAQRVVDERKLAEEWIAEAIPSLTFTEPDPMQPGAIRAFRRIAAFGNRVLRVVYYDAGAEYRVITVFFDR
jgi:hypothetical protein